MRAAIEDNKKLDPVKAGSYTLEQWLRLWYSVYIEPQVRYSTKEFYHNAIDHHIIPKLGNVKLERLTMLQIQQFYNELLKSGRVQKKNQPELKEHGHGAMRSCGAEQGVGVCSGRKADPCKSGKEV